MIYLARVPHPDDLARFYSTYGDHKPAFVFPKPVSRTQALLAARLNRYVMILKRTGGIAGKRVLDVGCSYGPFLQLCRHGGAQVEGVEIDQAALRFVQSLAIPVTEDITPGKTYDICFSSQVLEHLADPGELLRKMHAAVANGGRLLISMPNGGEADRVGPAWVGFRVDLEHLNYFSIRSLAELLSRHGFYVEQFWEHTQPSINERSVCPSLRSKITRKLEMLGQAVSQCEDRTEHGSFVLTALCRKTP